jgi:hypothetical protein
VIERAVAFAECDELRLEDLPASIVTVYRENLMPSFACVHRMREWGSRYPRLVLDRCGYNKRKAVASLGISYGAERPHFGATDRPQASVPQEAAITATVLDDVTPMPAAHAPHC